MRKRIIVLAGILAVVYGALVGCDDTGENARTATVSSWFNNGQPFIADVLEQGDSLLDAAGFLKLTDDFIAEDWIPVIFYSKPFSSQIITDPGEAHGDYLVERYRIVYESLDGGPTFPEYEGYTSIMVESDDDAPGMVVVVPVEYKLLPWVVALQYGGAPGNTDIEVFLRAHYTFYGREVGTDRESSFESSVTVNVFDWVIETENKR